MKTLLVIAVLALITISAPIHVLAHPSDGYSPYPLASTYGKEGYGLPADWEIGNLDLVQTYPDPATLTDAEIYMIKGCIDSPFGRPLFSWESVVLAETQRFYFRHGYIPEQLTPEVVAMAWDKPVSEVNPELLEEIVSPLTGDYPYLNAESFSPGNLLIRLLTEDEKWHIAMQEPRCYQHWYEGEYPPTTFDKEGPVRVLGVFYVKTCGWNDIIHTSIVTSGTSR